MWIYGITFSLRDGEITRTYTVHANSLIEAIQKAFLSIQKDKRLTAADLMVFDLSVALLSFK